MDIAHFAMFMDKFGVVCFLFIIIYASYHLLSMRKKRKPLDVATVILLLIGIGGLIVDSYIVGYNILNPISWHNGATPISQGISHSPSAVPLSYAFFLTAVISGIAIYFIRRKR